VTPPVFPPLLDLVLKPSVEREIYVARNPDGTFGAREVVKALKAIDARARGTIEGSLYLSAKAAGIPEAVIVDLIRIYSYDVDFQREVRAGDQFDLLYTNYIDDNGEALKSGAIQYAELTLSGDRKPLYRFTTGDDQATDYFTAKGTSGKRMLMRTPVDGARLTSGFGLRRHPILGYNKLHRGVDFGAASGTPVMAAGNGVVEKASWFGGYGQYVRLRHVNSYSTGYAHLSRFARGVAPGARVRQGQVIGYVGTTGRSTGPHLHYEVLINARQINPMGVKLPTGRTLGGQDLAAFQENVARIATLLQEPALVAQSELVPAAP
jgi:murein DD-endopeptidase MepM/ murein hydrolase activator NlpD